VSLEAAQLASLRAFYRLLAGRHPDSHLRELGDDGQACVAPATPGASIPNGVVYSDASALAAALPSLLELYGALPWLVWLRPDDAAAASACEGAGLKLDSRPALMGAPLGEISPPPPAAGFASRGTWADLARLNGLPPSLLDVPDDPAVRIYVAAPDGDAVSVVQTLDHGDNLGVYFVATLPEARGRGYATALMQTASAEARSRGLRTTPLESSAMGEPVYTRLGYRRLGELQMWEHRV